MLGQTLGFDLYLPDSLQYFRGITLHGLGLRYLYSIDDLSDDVFLGDIFCLSFIGESYSVSEYICAYVSDIIRDDKASSIKEGLCLGGLGEIDAGTWGTAIVDKGSEVL